MFRVLMPALRLTGVSLSLLLSYPSLGSAYPSAPRAAPQQVLQADPAGSAIRAACRPTFRASPRPSYRPSYRPSGYHAPSSGHTNYGSHALNDSASAPSHFEPSHAARVDAEQAGFGKRSWFESVVNDEARVPLVQDAATNSARRRQRDAGTYFAPGYRMSPHGGVAKPTLNLGRFAPQPKRLGLTTLVMLPHDAQQFARMFGEPPSLAQEQLVSAVGDRFAERGATLVSSDRATAAGTLALLQEKAKDHAVVTLIAHAIRSSDGNLEYVLLDGQRLGAREAAQAVANEGSELVVVSCFSKDIDPGAAIDLRDAFYVWSESVRGLNETYDAQLSRVADKETDKVGAAAVEPGAEYANIAASARGALITGLLTRADKVRVGYPRVGLSWTQGTASEAHALMTSERELKVPAGWMRWLSLLAAAVALCAQMIMMPRHRLLASFDADVLRAKLQSVFRTRRRLMHVSWLSMLVCVGIAIAAKLLHDASAGTLVVDWSSYVGPSAASVPLSGLSFVVARKPALESLLASYAHGIAGGIAGFLWTPMSLAQRAGWWGAILGGAACWFLREFWFLWLCIALVGLYLGAVSASRAFVGHHILDE